MNDQEILLKEDEAIDIPRRATHRAQNLGVNEISFIEIQTGEYFGEDDIERMEDDFGRV